MTKLCWQAMVRQTQTRKRHEASVRVLEAILEAAATEFASHGFEGASTRRIAENAGVFQAQLGYHVGNKEELWRATVDWLFARLREDLEKGFADRMDQPIDDPADALADIIRRHVRHAARHPELSRIMAVEASMATDRTKYLLDTHVRPTLEALRMVWDDVRAQGKGHGMEAEDVFMLMIGLASLPFAQGPLMKPLLGRNRVRPDDHAEMIVKWVLG
jgi:AcrR family transcriptional regulator